MEQWLFKWARTVRGRLMLLFSALVSLAIVEVSYLGSISDRQDRTNQMIHSANEVARLETNLLNQLYEQIRYVKSYLEFHDVDYLGRARKSDTFEKDLSELESLLESGDLSRIDPGLRLCKKIRQNYKTFLETIQSDEGLSGLQSSRRVDGLSQPVKDAITNLKEAVDSQARELSQRSARDSKHARYYVPFFMMAVVCIGGFITIFIQRRISHRLKELERATLYVARGDFTHRIDIRGRDELTDLAIAYNSMASRLNELDSLKREFISHVSHELKNPLAAIKQVNDFLSDGMIGSLNEKQKDLIRISQKNSNKLAEMLNNLLDISKMESGVIEYRMEEEDLVAVVRNCIHEMTPVCEDKQIKIGTIFVQPKLIFSFDKLRIGQVVNNLLGNAAKFTAQGGMIIVRVDRIDSAMRVIPERYRIIRSDMSLAKGYAIISVEDTGVGVPEDELDNIFEKFYQVHNGRKSHGSGTGLGLAISKSIVEAHEGFIWAELGNRQGTNLRFVLPLDSKVTTKTWHIVRPRGDVKTRTL